VGIGDFQNIVEVWFFLFVYWRTRLSSCLLILRGLVLSSDLVTLRGHILVLKFGGLDKVIKHKYCVSCVFMIDI
jgi:hypothetical protein